MKRKYIATGLLAGLTAGAGAGFLLEQSGSAGAASLGTVTVATDPVSTDPATGDSPTVSTSDSTTASTPAADDDADHTGFLTDALQPLIDDGTITQAQADAVIAAIDAARPNDGGGMHGRGGANLDTVATALGMTADELRTALESGSTLREIATSKGVDPQAVVDAIVADVQARLDERVTAGDLTQAEADAKLADVTTRATELLDSTGPVGGPGMGGGRMGGMHGGPGRMGGGDDDDDAADAPATDATAATTTG